MKRSQQTLIAFIAFICIASTSFIALAANNTETKRVAGNGKIQSKSVSLENFKGINVGGNFMMVINSGTEPKVVVTSDENILPYINLSVSHQQLNIGQQSGINLSPSKLTKIQITVPKLNNINISGNTMLQANNINTDSLALIMGGKTSGNLQGEIKIYN
ncbi:MAG: DUF2807 domain-containing protein [Coxiellaceae bacterium]|nr:MAG: DUF2807 domain-containing protein [Coxiellaceae bacterium]